MERILSINRVVSSQFLADLLTSAVEGVATGQWLDVTLISRAGKSPTPEYEMTDHLSVVRLLDPTNSEEGGRFDAKDFMPGFEGNRDANSISLNTVMRGLQRLYERTPDGDAWLVLPKRNDLRGQFLALDAADFDSIDADIIIQLGFFGDMVFG